MTERSSRHIGPLGTTVSGLFAPDSVSRRLHRDPLIGLASLRGLLLAALQPDLAASPQHAAGDVWQDLRELSEHLDVLTFGTAAQALTASSRDRTRRDRSTFALAWRHCCLLDAHIRVLSRSGLPLTRADAGRYVREQTTVAVLAGLEPQDVPNDLAGLQSCLDALRPRAPAGQPARMYAGAVTSSRPRPGSARWPVASRPVWSPVAGLAFATLPQWARRAYDATGLSGAAALYDAGATVALRAVRESLTDSASLQS